MYQQMSKSVGPYSKLILVGDDDSAIVKYDITKNEWSHVLFLKQPMRFFQVTPYKDRVIIAGGIICGDSVCIPSQAESHIHMFDSTTDEVHYHCGNLPVPLFNFKICSHNDSIFVLGGKSHCDCNPTSDVYKSSGDLFKWDAMSPMEIPRFEFSSVVHNGFIYVFGGRNENGLVSECAKYDILSDSWSPISSMFSARAGTAASVLSGLIYVVGGMESRGEYGCEEVSKVEIYDPENDLWTKGTDMETSRSMLSLMNVGECLYAIGGVSGDDIIGSYEIFKDGKWVEHYDAPLDGFLDGAAGL